MIEENNILREKILEKIEPFIGKNLIKVITGQRRVGKSCILRQLKRKSSIPTIYINKELYDFDFIKDHRNLIEYIIETSEKNNFTAIYIDEIQDINNFEKALRHFQATGKYDIYCTGSNAKLLSGELSTFLSGRYIQFNVHSLSFDEFKNFYKSDSIDKYLAFGGMPYLINLELRNDLSNQYLYSVYESIILKDIVERYSFRNIKLLHSLVKYICDNIGSITSANNIAKFLKSQQININVTTILNYIEALKNCYFIYEVPRFDIIGKKFFEINHKYYIEDHGIRNSILGYTPVKDDAKLLENLVFMHLKRNDYNISVGVIAGKEIDFIAEKNNEKIYIQVALKVDSDATFEREFGNLKIIKDNYPKYVITKDTNINQTNTVDGINHIGINEFLSTYNF